MIVSHPSPDGSRKLVRLEKVAYSRVHDNAKVNNGVTVLEDDWWSFTFGGLIVYYYPVED
jgi:hypothetical protein